MRKIVIFFLFLIALFKPSYGFFLGNQDDEGFILYPRHVNEGPDGNIYAYDEKDSYIKVYSPTGKFLRKIGGPGEGPGYIKRNDGVNFGFTNDNKLFFTEYFQGHRWITIMNLDGHYQKVVAPDIKRGMFGISKAMALPDGGFIIHAEFMGGTEKKGRYYLGSNRNVIYKIDSKGAIISKIKEASFFTTLSFEKFGGDLGIPFSPRCIWDSIKGDAIIYTEGASKNLSILNSEGKLIKEIKTSLPDPIKVTAMDLKQWRDTMRNSFMVNSHQIEFYKKFGKVIEEYTESVYNQKTMIQSIAVTPSGNILLTGAINENKENDFWLVSGAGKMLINLKLKIWGLDISKNFLFLRLKDAEDNECIYCLKRKGTEVVDLKRCLEVLNKIK
ncbi:MAG: hypothetical protein ACM3SY_10500 [Candidatus Omnitrophota bacterium]